MGNSGKENEDDELLWRLAGGCACGIAGLYIGDDIAAYITKYIFGSVPTLGSEALEFYKNALSNELTFIFGAISAPIYLAACVTYYGTWFGTAYGAFKAGSGLSGIGFREYRYRKFKKEKNRKEPDMRNF